jgi:hypothetical protein
MGHPEQPGVVDGAGLLGRPWSGAPVPRRRGGSGGLGESRLDPLHQGLERLRLANGEIGEHLAVDLDPRPVDAVDELGVSEPVLARAGVDALNPEPAEAAFAGAPVAIGVLEPLLDALDGDAKDVLAAAAIAFRRGDDLLVPSVGGDAPFDTMRASTADMTVVPRALRFIFWDRLRRLWRLQA